MHGLRYAGVRQSGSRSPWQRPGCLDLRVQHMSDVSGSQVHLTNLEGLRVVFPDVVHIGTNPLAALNLL